MSQKLGYGLNGKSYYSNITTPQDTSVQFTVAPSNGLGVTSVKSNGYVRNVFMHTSGAPSSNNGYTNPNPANGYALIQFNNPFNYYLNGVAQFLAPSTGSIKIDNSALTAGTVYVISVVGNSSAAAWAAVGVPPGITPAVGVSFVALTVGAGANTSTSRVSSPTSSGIDEVELVGLPNTMVAPANLAVNGGAWLTMQFMLNGVATAPATGTIVCMKFSYDASSVTIDGL
jgi:hypothetical protein